MTITLNHTIVAARDNAAPARKFAQPFALTYEERDGYFAPAKVSNALSFPFRDDAGAFESRHYAFHVSDAELAAIFGRIGEAGLT